MNKPRSKRILAIVAFCSILLTSACMEPEALKPEPQSNASIQRMNRDASYIGFDNLEALEDRADLIVTGTPVLPFEERNHEQTYYEDGVMESFSTVTEFSLDSVIKDQDQVIQDDKITFIEPISLTEREDGVKMILSIADYKELEYGESYLIFLADNTLGDYGIINMNNGTFNLNRLDRSNGDPIHQQLMTEAFTKYALD